MKKITLLLAFVFAFSFTANAQLFRVASCNGTIASNTYGPMNSVAAANATNITATIYPASQLTGISGQVLNAIYFNRYSGTAAMAGTPNFKIYLKETAATDFGASAITWATEIATATLVYDSNPASVVGTTTGWKQFPLSTNFTYSGTQNLVVYMQYTNPTASTLMGWEYEYSAPCISTTNSNTTKYANNTTGVMPTATTTSNYRRPHIGFDFVVSCNAPTALTAANVTATTADLSWTAHAIPPANGYEYYLSTTNTAPTAGTTPTGTTAAGVTTVALSGLPSGVNHFAWVRAVCGATDKSVWTTVRSFTTLCLPITTLPWTENFDTLATGDQIFPPCWASFNTASVWNIETTPVAQSGANSLGRTWSTDGWAFTPTMTLDAGTSYDFSYFMKAVDTTAPGYDVTVAVGNSQSVAGMTTTLSTVTGHTNATWTKFTHTFTPTTTGDYSFGVRALVTVSAPNGINFDTFKLELTPTCVEPTAVTSSAVTATTATISWTAPASAPADGYEYYYSTTNTAPTVSTTPSGATAAGITTANLTMLTPATTYFVWVRSVCSASDISGWSQFATFTTLCLPVTTLPWTEGFEGLAIGNNIFPPCWSFANTLSVWNIETTPVANTGANSLGRTWSTDGWAFTPTMTLNAGTSYDFSYFIRTQDATVGYDITVGVGTAQNAAGMTTTLSTVTGYQGPAWVKVTHAFIPTTSGDYSFGIRVVAPVAPNGINFDDMKVDVTPTCVNPTAVTSSAVTATTATISWTAPASAPADGYEYYYSTTNTAPTVSTTPSGATAAGITTANLTMLTPATTYFVWVRSVCSASDISGWSSSATFTTLCASFVPTYTQDFATFLPSCWTNTNGGTVATGPVGTGTNIWEADGFLNAGGTGAIKVNLYDVNRIGWAISPTIDMSAGGYRVKFDYALSTWNGTTPNTMAADDVVQLVASQDGGATWAVVTTFNAASAVSNATNNFVLNLPTYTSANTKFAFYANDGTVDEAQDYDFFIDNFVIETAPPCVSPTITFATVSNCPAATFNVTANVTNLGSATALSISDDQGGTPETVTATGLVTFGPYANGTTVILTAVHNLDTACNVDSTTQTQASCPPANDNCGGAISLTPAGDFATGSVSGTILNATNAAGIVPTCSIEYSTDVWYSVSVPASGNITIETQTDTANSMTDSVIAAFSGTCGALNQVGCNQNNGASNMSLLSLTGQTPMSTLYIGVWKNGVVPPATNEVQFKISAYDASLSTDSFDSTYFSAVPNPVKDILKLSYNKDITNVAIYNILGQEMMIKNINAAQSDIDMSKLATGTYMVKVTADGQSKTIKVVKQ